jgi:hypothetical protein
VILSRWFTTILTAKTNSKQRGITVRVWLISANQLPAVAGRGWGSTTPWPRAYGGGRRFRCRSTRNNLRPSRATGPGLSLKRPPGCRGSASGLRICSHVLGAAEGWVSLRFPRPLLTLNKHRTLLSIQVGKTYFLRRSEATKRSPPAQARTCKTRRYFAATTSRTVDAGGLSSHPDSVR